MAQALTYNVLGADLAMTRYTGGPANVPLEVADTWGSLDLSAVPGGRGGLRFAVRGDIRDYSVVTGRANLAQALILRLVTQKSTLADLGHPEYGSRLVELIGRGNTDTTRNLARLYTLEALAAEPRVAKILDLSVTVISGQPDSLAIAFSVVPVNDSEPLGLVLEVKL